MANDNQIAVKKRLIYAEDLFEPVDFTVLQMGGRGGKTMAMYEQLFRKRVEMAPTIDAVEVVHGRLEFRPSKKYKFVIDAVCTACNVVIDSHPEYLLEYRQMAIKKKLRYCPACGARMDMKEDDHGR